MDILPEQVFTLNRQHANNPLSRLRQKKAALEFLMQPTFNPLRSLALDRTVLAIEKLEGLR